MKTRRSPTSRSPNAARLRRSSTAIRSFFETFSGRAYSGVTTHLLVRPGRHIRVRVRCCPGIGEVKDPHDREVMTPTTAPREPPRAGLIQTGNHPAPPTTGTAKVVPEQASHRLRGHTQGGGSSRSIRDEFLQSLRGSAGLGRGVLWTFGLVFSLLILESVILAGGAPPLPLLAAMTIPIAIPLGFCLLARRFLLPRVTGRVTPWIVLSVYACAGLARGVILSSICAWFNLTLPLVPPQISAPMAVIVMSIAALTSRRSQQHRAKMIELAALRWRLQELNENFASMVRMSNSDMADRVRSFLEPAVSNIRDLLDRPGDTSSDHLSQAMVATVSDVVRPLVTELANRPTEKPWGSEGERVSKVIFRVWDTPVNVVWSVMPLVILGISVFGLAYRHARMPTSTINLAYVLMEASVTVLLLIACKFWPQRLMIVTLRVAAMVLFCLFLVSAMLPALVMSVLMRAGMADAFPFPWASLALWVTLGLGASAPSLVEQLAHHAREAAASVNLDLELRHAQFQRQIWINRRNVTWVLHGPIQSALISSAMMLSHDGENPEARDKVRASLTDAIARLESNQMAHPALEPVLADIASVWSSSCRVIWQVDAVVGPLVVSDRDAIRCLGEIAREGVSNSIRHGSATVVDILIDVPADEIPGVIRVRISDDGLGMASPSIPGYGSEMLDELTLSWTRVSETDGTLLTAFVPVVTETGSSKVVAAAFRQGFPARSFTRSS